MEVMVIYLMTLDLYNHLVIYNISGTFVECSKIILSTSKNERKFGDSNYREVNEEISKKLSLLQFIS